MGDKDPLPPVPTSDIDNLAQRIRAAGNGADNTDSQQQQSDTIDPVTHRYDETNLVDAHSQGKIEQTAATWPPANLTTQREPSPVNAGEPNYDRVPHSELTTSDQKRTDGPVNRAREFAREHPVATGIGGLIIAGGAIFGGAELASGGPSHPKVVTVAENSHSPTDSPSGTATETSSPTDTTLPGSNNTTSVSVTPNTPETSAEPSADTPVLMNAGTAEGLVKQFQHNMNCLYGNWSALGNDEAQQIQQACENYIFGTTIGNAGQLGTNFQDTLNTIETYRDQHNPGYEPNLVYTLIDQATEPNGNITITTSVAQNDQPTTEARFTFQRGTIEGVGLESWLLVKQVMVAQ